MSLTEAQTNITEDDDAGWSGARNTAAASSEPDVDDPEAEGTPPAEGETESSPTDSEPAEAAAEEEVDGAPKKPETAEAKAEREKQEQIAKRWAIVEKAKKEHLAVAKQRKELESSTLKLETERQQFAHERQLHARTVQEAQQVLDVIARVRANPTIEGLRALGFDYMSLTTEMVNANTPEAIARAAADETRQLREQLQRQQRDQATAAANRADAQRLVAHVEENEELYPDLASYPAERIAADGIKERDEYFQEHKRYPTYEQVVAKLQERAKAFEDARKAKAAKRAAGTNSETSPASPNGNGHQANRPTGKPSIGNAAVTQRASAPRAMTEEEKDEWALSQLRALSGGRR
jgi:hypothetical protein